MARCLFQKLFAKHNSVSCVHSLKDLTLIIGPVSSLPATSALSDKVVLGFASYESGRHLGKHFSSWPAESSDRQDSPKYPAFQRAHAKGIENSGTGRPHAHVSPC